MGRKAPNILITGTPCVGKTTLCNEIIKKVDLQILNINDVAKMRDCFCGYDVELECWILDEDKLLDELEPVLDVGGKLVEYHSCEMFPERWFDYVFVLTTDNTILYDRLAKRGYNHKKITKNVECEIFRNSITEAQSSYNREIVYELESNTDADVERNTALIVGKINEWIMMNKKDGCM